MKDDSPQPQSLLLVEDSAEDYEAVTRIFRKIAPDIPVFWCQSGAEAIDFLKNRKTAGSQAKTVRPTLMLLDLNMPGMDGRETLRLVKQDEALKQMPVVIFTTSADEKDIEECYGLGANTYVQKPFSYDKLVEIVTALKQYWFETALSAAAVRK